MKKILFLFAFLFTCSITSAQDHEIKLDRDQDADQVHVMLSETQVGKYRYGRGKWTLLTDMIDMLVDSLTDRGELSGGAGDGNGIYSGSDTVPAGVTATLTDYLRLTIGSGNPYMNIHAPTGNNTAFCQYTNTTTGNATTDGFIVGINISEAATLNQRENNSIIFLTNNTARYTIDGNGDATYNTIPDVSTTPQGYVNIDTTTGAVTMYKQPYKVYTAILSSGDPSDPPTVTILGDNTIGNIVWTYEDVGHYRGTLASAFTAAKTWFSVANEFNSVTSHVEVNRNTTSAVDVKTTDNTGNPADGLLLNCSLEIRVYN